MRKPQEPPEPEKGAIKLFLKDMEDEKIMGLVTDFNRRYLHWDEVRRRDLGGVRPEVVWTLMGLYRSMELKIRKFGSVEIRYSFIEDFMRSVHEIDTMSSVGFFSGEGMTEKNRTIYAVSSIMEESIASSQIEGASTTLSKAKEMLRENRHPKDKSERMIMNNYNAMRYIKSKKDESLTPELVLEAHRIITRGTLDDESYEGMFRDSDDVVVQDWTGEVYHTPIPFREIESSLNAVCRYVDDDSEFEHPILKGIILHFLIAYIHPFMDGNGRLARALFYWYALKKGYWAIEFLSISKAIKSHRGRYDMAYLLSETDGNDVTYFIKFNLEQIETAYDTFRDYVERKLKEQNDLENEIMDKGDFNLRQKSILKDAMKSNEPFSVYSVQEKYQTSYQTARTDILKLVSAGYIKLSGKKGNMALYSYNGAGV